MGKQEPEINLNNDDIQLKGEMNIDDLDVKVNSNKLEENEMDEFVGSVTNELEKNTNGRGTRVNSQIDLKD